MSSFQPVKYFEKSTTGGFVPENVVAPEELLFHFGAAEEIGADGADVQSSSGRGRTLRGQPGGDVARTLASPTSTFVTHLPCYSKPSWLALGTECPFSDDSHSREHLFLWRWAYGHRP
jgi:hypothetical protein